MLADMVQQHAVAYPLKVRLLSDQAIPFTRGTDGAAGFDLYAPRAVCIPPQHQEVILTDLAVQLPPYGKIQDRSGNTVKHRLRVEAGLIDQDFSGNVGVVVKNEGSSQYRIQPEDTIAQMTVDLCLQPEVLVVQDLTTTARGSKGWGSTDTPDLVVSPSPELPYTSQCTDDLPLIHSRCPPTIPWHNQFMPPLFLYLLYII